MARLTTITIALDIKGTPEDAQHVVDSLLDAGFFQDAINDHDADAGPLHVKSALIASCERKPPRRRRHAGTHKWAVVLEAHARTWILNLWRDTGEQAETAARQRYPQAQILSVEPLLDPDPTCGACGKTVLDGRCRECGREAE